METWQSYKEWVSGVIESKKNYYYRGQLDCSGWKLQTTFHRLVERKKLAVTLSNYLKDIIPSVNYYISAWHNELFNLDNPNDLASLLSLLQHYGFPTPLLDWTMSPYIAAYFAFKEVKDERPQCDYVKIFIFDYNEWRKIFPQPLDLMNTLPFVSIVLPYARYNYRIVNQQGAYTVTNIPDMTAHIEYNGKLKGKTFLYQFTFSAMERTKVMRELDLMGINEMSLFPGIDGICRTMCEKFFSKDEVGFTDSELLRQVLKNLKFSIPPTAARLGERLGEVKI